jgi:two-component system NarL family response regulator
LFILWLYSCDIDQVFKSLNSTHNILLADDHDLVRQSIRVMIESESDFRVCGEARSGREAVELIGELRPDIAVIDITMPGLNGVDACRQITKLVPRCKVIALSAHLDRRHVTEMLDAGAFGYVAKDDAAEDLLRALRAIASGRRYLSPRVSDVAVESLNSRQTQRADPLGSREREVLQLLAEGMTSGEIATEMGIATATVDTHRRNIMRKLDLHSVAELTKHAIREGLTGLD